MTPSKILSPGEERLLENPYLKFSFLIFLSAVFRPYMGIYHDSLLYAVEALHRSDAGLFAGDMYFRFGTQGENSLFFVLATPLVSLLGVEDTFFILYVLARLLYVYAALSITQFLVPSARWSFICASAMVLSPIPYGAFEVFHTSENFVTPRLFSEALCIWSVSLFFRGSSAKSFLVAGIGFLLHPLIALPCLLYLLLAKTGQLIGWKYSLYSFVAVFIPFLSLLLLGQFSSFLGTFDSHWKLLVYKNTSYNLYFTWRTVDWMRVCGVFVALGTACFCLNQKKRMLAYSLMLVGLTCWATSFAGRMTDSLLIFQAQLHRVMWLLSILAIPLMVQAVLVTWGFPERRKLLVMMVFLSYVLMYCHSLAGLVLFGACMLFLSVFFRGIKPKPRSPVWLESAVIGAAIFTPFTEIFGTLVGGITSMPFSRFSPQEWVLLVVNSGAPLALGVLAFALWSLLRVSPKNAKAVRYSFLALAVLLFILSHLQVRSLNAFSSDSQRSNFSQLEIVQNYLREHSKNLPERLEIYWPGKCNIVWLHLKQHCYFDIREAAPVLFFRELGEEIETRFEKIGAVESKFKDVWPQWLLPRLTGEFSEPASICTGQNSPDVIIGESAQGNSESLSIKIQNCKQI